MPFNANTKSALPCKIHFTRLHILVQPHIFFKSIFANKGIREEKKDVLLLNEETWNEKKTSIRRKQVALFIQINLTNNIPNEISFIATAIQRKASNSLNVLFSTS